jgi:hypothetical protein
MPQVEFPFPSDGSVIIIVLILSHRSSFLRSYSASLSPPFVPPASYEHLQLFSFLTCPKFTYSRLSQYCPLPSPFYFLHSTSSSAFSFISVSLYYIISPFISVSLYYIISLFSSVSLYYIISPPLILVLSHPITCYTSRSPLFLHLHFLLHSCIHSLSRNSSSVTLLRQTSVYGLTN